MKQTNTGNTFITEFTSLSEFKNYIDETPQNSVFSGNKERQSSYTGRRSFTFTDNMEEAVRLFTDGWPQQAEELTKTLRMKDVKAENESIKFIRDVVGFQASVPRYLNGHPKSMINKKVVTHKQKVITINKSINYACFVSTANIVIASTEALRIVKKIEEQGIRVNLNIIWGTKAGERNIIVKVRVKNANERLNISKLSFPLIHPSMLRRLFFRFLEVCPYTTRDFTFGYGRPLSDEENREHNKGEYCLPSLLKYQEAHGLESIETYRITK